MLDRNEIERIACSVHTHEILRGICILEARAKNDGSAIDYATALPPLTDPISERAVWWSARGIERHPDEFYPTYHAIARITKPKVIAEIGVWWGYALMAAVTGCLYPNWQQSGGPRKVEHVYGFDNESYPEAGNCLDWCGRNLDYIGVPNTMLHCNSQDFANTGLPPMRPVDLFSVDGDHNYQAAYRDLILAERVMNLKNQNAVIIVDDVGWALNLRDAVNDFCDKYKWEALYLPTLKGTAVLTRQVKSE